jgi:uncharacterized protein YaaQ
MAGEAMQLLVMVVQEEDANAITDALIDAGFPGATRMSSHGVFLRQRNVTLLVAVPRSQVTAALRVVAAHGHSRAQYVDPLPPLRRLDDPAVAYPLEVQVGAAVVFILDLERYERW